MDMGEGGGEFWFTETLKHFFVLKIPEILIGQKVYSYSPLFLQVQVRFVCHLSLKP